MVADAIGASPAPYSLGMSANRIAPLALGILGAFASCGVETAGPDPGVTLLDVMIQIDHAYKSIEPSLRNPAAFRGTARAARQILDWAADPEIEEFIEEDRFIGGDRERYFALRDRMAGGAQRVLDATESGDLDDLRQGFIEMKTSCIACHKRFSPSF